MAKIRQRLVYRSSDGTDHENRDDAVTLERRIVISRYFENYETVYGPDKLGLTERQAQELVKFLATELPKMYEELEKDELV